MLTGIACRADFSFDQRKRALCDASTSAGGPCDCIRSCAPNLRKATSTLQSFTTANQFYQVRQALFRFPSKNNFGQDYAAEKPPLPELLSMSSLYEKLEAELEKAEASIRERASALARSADPELTARLQVELSGSLRALQERISELQLLYGRHDSEMKEMLDQHATTCDQ